MPSDLHCQNAGNYDVADGQNDEIRWRVIGAMMIERLPAYWTVLVRNEVGAEKVAFAATRTTTQ